MQDHPKASEPYHAPPDSTTPLLGPSLDACRPGNVELLQGRLPDELWLGIWTYLCCIDRIRISRVCWRWRSIALGSPQLWSLVDFNCSDNDYNCDCYSCDVWSMAEGEWGTPVPRRANFKMLDYLLSRSWGLPLSIYLHVSSWSVCTTSLETFAAQLSSHAHRMISLSFDSGDQGAAPYILRRLPSLPALRTLQASTSYSDPEGAPGHLQTGTVLCDVFMPALQHLEISGVHFANISTSTSVLSSLVSLTCPFCSTDQLVTLLQASPNLRELDIDDVEQREYESMSAFEHVQPLASRIATVRVRDISSANAEVEFLAMFRDASRPSLSISYYDFIPDRGFDIFRDLAVLKDLHIIGEYATDATIGVVDSNGRRRELDGARVHDFALRTLRDGPMKHIDSLTVDLCILRDTLAELMDVCTGIRTLVVFGCTCSADLAIDDSQVGAVSELANLRIECTVGAGAVELHADSVAAFVRSLAHGRRLASLALTLCRITNKDTLSIVAEVITIGGHSYTFLSHSTS